MSTRRGSMTLTASAISENRHRYAGAARRHCAPLRHGAAVSVVTCSTVYPVSTAVGIGRGSSRRGAGSCASTSPPPVRAGNRPAARRGCRWWPCLPHAAPVPLRPGEHLSTGHTGRGDRRQTPDPRLGHLRRVPRAAHMLSSPGAAYGLNTGAIGQPHVASAKRPGFPRGRHANHAGQRRRQRCADGVRVVGRGDRWPLDGSCRG